MTEQWTTIAVVGPQSREVVAHLAPEVDLSNEAFPFMAFRETTLASGIPARICRISFSGELAYEINVSAWYGRAVWEEVYAIGRPYDITPYGTETMHVLRAEKGYIIVGQDTDGTVTPQDAGMSWVVSKRKDFVGSRSYSRADTSRTDRKQLVGLLPERSQDPATRGHPARRAERAPTPSRPVPMLGHVTSSYHSPALGRPFALALVADGRAGSARPCSPRWARTWCRSRWPTPSSTTPKGPSEMAEPTIAAGAGAGAGAGPAALRRSPLTHLAERMRDATVTGARGVALTERPFLTMVNLRVVPLPKRPTASRRTWGRRSRGSAATPPHPAPTRSAGSAPTSGWCCPRPTGPLWPPGCGRHLAQTRARWWTSRRTAPRWS